MNYENKTIKSKLSAILYVFKIQIIFQVKKTTIILKILPRSDAAQSYFIVVHLLWIQEFVFHFSFFIDIYYTKSYLKKKSIE